MIMFWIYWILKCGRLGHSLVAQWLGLGTFRVRGFAPGWGARSTAAEHAPPTKEIHFADVVLLYFFKKTFPPVLMRI